MIYNAACFDILHGCSWDQWCDAEENLSDLGWDPKSGNLVNILAYHVFAAALREELDGDEEDLDDDDDEDEV